MVVVGSDESVLIHCGMISYVVGVNNQIADSEVSSVPEASVKELPTTPGGDPGAAIKKCTSDEILCPTIVEDKPVLCLEAAT
jgi:hypothetical protein